MTAKAVVVAIFGVGFVLIPGTLASFYGMTFDGPAGLMAQLFGALFISEAIILWLNRNEPASNPAMQPIMLGVVVSNAIGFLVCLFATLNGVWNALGWLSVGLFLLFGLAFAYFLFGKRPA